MTAIIKRIINFSFVCQLTIYTFHASQCDHRSANFSSTSASAKLICIPIMLLGHVQRGHYYRCSIAHGWMGIFIRGHLKDIEFGFAIALTILSSPTLVISLSSVCANLVSTLIRTRPQIYWLMMYCRFVGCQESMQKLVWSPVYYDKLMKTDY